MIRTGTPHAAGLADQRRRWCAGLGLAVLMATTSTAVAAFALGPVPVSLFLFATLAWYAVPGWYLASAFYADQRIAWLIGPLWGYVLSNLSLLALWWAGLRHPAVALLAPLPALVAARLLAPRAVRLAGPAIGRSDIVAVLILLSMVPAIVGRPFSQVGRVLPQGVAYRAYFTADFIWARTVVVELAKAERSPRNMFLRDEALNYYWLPHLLSAVEYRWNRTALTPDRILLVNGIGLGLVFVAFLYGFIRHFAASALGSAIACAFALAFVSVEASWYLWRLWQQGRPLDAVLSMNVDGLTRWVLGSVPVDGLHRLLLYQPTHHAVAYGAGLSALAAVAVVRDPVDSATAWLAGTLLGGGLLFSSFSAAMIGVAVGLCWAGRLVAAQQWSRVPGLAVRAAIPIAIAVGVSIGLRYVDAANGLVELGVNRMATRNAALAISISFGFLLPAGLLGLIAGLAMKQWRTLALAALLVVSFLFYFLVNVRDHQNVYVAWRAGHVLIIALAALLAILWERLWANGLARRVVTLACFVIAACVAAPTTVLDAVSSQDVFNRGRGPGFRWTVILSPGEVEGLAWLRQRTHPDAIVQAEPFVRGRDTWSYVPAFAERRMAAGLPISMVPLEKYRRASERIRALYVTRDAAEAYDRAARERIDYLLIGAPERAAYPGFGATLASRPDLFVRVFENHDLTIYHLRGSPR